MEAAFEDCVFLAAHDSRVSNLSGLKDKFPLERFSDIAFQMEVPLLRLRQALNYWWQLLSKVTGNYDS